MVNVHWALSNYTHYPHPFPRYSSTTPIGAFSIPYMAIMAISRQRKEKIEDLTILDIQLTVANIS